MTKFPADAPIRKVVKALERLGLQDGSGRQPYLHVTGKSWWIQNSVDNTQSPNHQKINSSHYPYPIKNIQRRFLGCIWFLTNIFHINSKRVFLPPKSLQRTAKTATDFGCWQSKNTMSRRRTRPTFGILSDPLRIHVTRILFPVTPGSSVPVSLLPYAIRVEGINRIRAGPYLRITHWIGDPTDWDAFLAMRPIA